MDAKIGQRLPMRSSPDPFDRLSRAVNAMLDKLETALENVRALGDDIAHELRTPLTRLRARLERGCQDAETPAAFQNVGEDAVRDIDHALSIVSAILRIREIDEAKRGTEFRQVDLRGLLADAVDLYRPTADDRHIRLDLLSGAAPTVVADRDLLMEAVCNLIDNAIKFTPSGGIVTCAIATDTTGLTLLRVCDTGPGISADERSAVMRRFHRGAHHQSAPGHDIGLSLVAAIVRLHGFRLEIADAAKGCSMAIVCACRAADRHSEYIVIDRWLAGRNWIAVVASFDHGSISSVRKPCRTMPSATYLGSPGRAREPRTARRISSYHFEHL